VDETPTGYPPPPGEEAIVAALRAGDKRMFAELVTAWGLSMLRVARLYVRTRAVAKEVVQETWLDMLAGIGLFEGRSSLKTWVVFRSWTADTAP
jgi:RNA polymerase sigma-70 factor, ECF subfamily